VTKALVTGVGAVTSIGMGAHEFWKNLTAGESGITTISSFDSSALSVHIAGEVHDFESGDYMDGKAAKRMSRFSQFAVAAARMAAEDAAIKISEEESHRAGACVATGAGGVIDTILETEKFLKKGPARVGPFFVPTMAPNMGACQVSINLGLRGPVLATVAACAAGLYSFIEAKHLIESDMADIVFAGGTEAALHPLPIAALANMKALSRNNDDPKGASRPFDANRDGFVFGEGAAIMVIESEEHATARNAKVYAELAGGGLSSDAFHITAPREDGSGGAHAMKNALKATGMATTDIDYIAAHGTSTPLNDAAETAGMKLAFGDDASRLAISSPKSMIGHLLGGAGALGALTAILAVHHDIAPPTLNLETPDPACDLDYVPQKARAMTIRASMANGFGFGGQNGSVIFRKYPA